VTEAVNEPEGRDGPPRGLLIAAVAVAVAVVIVILSIAAIRQGSPTVEPVPIAGAPAPAAQGPECAAVLASLPDQLGDYRRAPTVEPTPAGTAAWRAESVDDPVILRCGLDRPTDFVVGAPLQVVNEVQWLRTQDEEGASLTWWAVDRPVYVALTLPADAGPTPIQVISDVLAKSMPATPLDPAPAR
jgi:hypothetical protein